MAKTYRMNHSVTITKQGGETETLQGGQASSFISQLERGTQIIRIKTDTDVKYYNAENCICNVEYTVTQGEEYTPYDAEPLFCEVTN